MAIAQFDFSQTESAGVGLNLPEGPYKVLIAKMEDQPAKDDGSVSTKFTLKIDPSEGVSGTVSKSLRYPRGGDPTDGVLTFWKAVFEGAWNRSGDDLSKNPVNGDPIQHLVNRHCYIYFTPDARESEPDENGKTRMFYDVRFISPKAYQDQKQQAAAGGAAAPAPAAGAGMGGAGAVMPTGGGFQPAPQQAVPQQAPAQQAPMGMPAGGAPPQAPIQPNQAGGMDGLLGDLSGGGGGMGMG